MFLIAGLGNPGARYARTRHNIGWMVLDELSRRWNLELTKRAHQAATATTQIGEHRVLVAKPQTYMNESGRAVGALLRYNKIELPHLLVICDDLNLPVGKLRLRANGSDGGQNGLKSVAQNLGSTQYARLRFGVGMPSEEERQQRGTADFVLSPFLPDEIPSVQDGIERATDCIEAFVREDLQTAMNRFNG
ncbi:MAG TPA: aminoacyl-tRNA hydrolase [Abditibacteriaceae bacterium]|nr:aminoacyl-tRNA hydrolase [Abditibacteriaceae bacterium]